MAGSNGTTTTTLRVGAESSAVVGNTPLVALPRLGPDLPGEVVAKLAELEQQPEHSLPTRAMVRLPSGYRDPVFGSQDECQ